jgi:hypothetical protein
MLRLLVGKALADKRDLVSLMAQLNCATGWERLLMRTMMAAAPRPRPAAAC